MTIQNAPFSYKSNALRKADFDMVRYLMIETGVLNKKLECSDSTGTSFSDNAKLQTSWKYEPGIAAAKCNHPSRNRRFFGK